jgi:hypothetical protein
MQLFLVALAIGLLLIMLYNCGQKERFPNNPYTIPFMNEKISSLANFQCIYHTIPLVVNQTYSQT